METFAIRLRELRKEENLTIKELAEKVNYSKSIISYWENGSREPTLSAINTLANFFSVTTDYLLGLEDDFGQKTTPAATENYTAEEKNIIEDYRELNPSGQKLVKDVIKNLQASTQKSFEKDSEQYNENKSDRA